MNKQKLLDWLISESDDVADQYYDEMFRINQGTSGSIKKILYEINNRRELELPKQIPTDFDNAPFELAHKNPQYHNRVDLLSYLLHQYFPEKYLFFRPSTLDFEIFTGLDFFGEIINDLNFEFSHVSRYSINEYLEFNRVMLKLANDWWPIKKEGYFHTEKRKIEKHYSEKLQNRVNYFLYQGIASLFLNKDNYKHYWLIATKEEYFDKLYNPEIVWSGHKEMKKDDIVFVYRMNPVKAITDIFQVSNLPDFDPYSAWDGFWVKLRLLSPIHPITFENMRKDDVLQDCYFIRKNFQGSITEYIPHKYYNRLLDFVEQKIKDKTGLLAEKIVIDGTSGDFKSEEDFEERMICPLLKQWKFTYKRQYPCKFYIGGQISKTRVDFLVSNEHGPITLFENKLRILDDKMLNSALKQAKSYALMLGISSFVVSSPEGIWIYSLDKNIEMLQENISFSDLPQQEENIRKLLLRYQRIKN